MGNIQVSFRHNGSDYDSHLFNKINSDAMLPECVFLLYKWKLI